VAVWVVVWVAVVVTASTVGCVVVILSVVDSVTVVGTRSVMVDVRLVTAVSVCTDGLAMRPEAA
jgi:hypothetical protein